MTVDSFTSKEFEAALPSTSSIKWRRGPIDRGEMTYFIDFSNEYAEIEVRSSLDRWGNSAATGENSIRVNLIAKREKRAIANKLKNWTTRVFGWEERMNALIQEFIRYGNLTSPCEVCPTGRILNIVKEKSGKLALSCTAKDPTGRRFLNHYYEPLDEWADSDAL